MTEYVNKQDLKNFGDELVLRLTEKLTEALSTGDRASNPNGWIESDEARKQLGVSRRTWQRYRDERIIPFTQFGRKIFCKQSDIESFMMSNYISKGL